MSDKKEFRAKEWIARYEAMLELTSQSVEDGEKLYTEKELAVKRNRLQKAKELAFKFWFRNYKEDAEAVAYFYEGKTPEEAFELEWSEV